ncbi:MAG: ABC transporter substrate-binding protein [Vicinamibacterales bacterium]
MKTVLPCLTSVLLASLVLLHAQGSAEAVLQYRGADRDARLRAGATKEGRVSLYTSLAPTESTPLAAAFEKKYGIEVDLWRATSDQVVQRTVTEARGRRRAVDVIETNGPEMEMLARERLLVEFASPYLADLPPNAIPRHRTWVPDRMNFFVVGYNTTRVRRDEIPSTYEGFLDAKWKGRLALEATDTEWMATLMKTWGTEKGTAFFTKLAAQGVDLRQGHVLLSTLVAAGEVPVGLSMYNANIVALQRKGAPIDFVPVQPVVARPQGIGIAKDAPHPHAALLFADFVLSPEGQQLFESLGRVPVSTRVKTTLNNFPYTTIDPATVLDEAAKWEQVWKGFFQRR